MNVTLSPDDLRRRIAESSADPSLLAHLDQEQAALDDNRDIASWWAALMVLAVSRNNDVAYAMALHNLRLFLAQLREDRLSQLTGYMFGDLIYRIAQYEHDGDAVAAVASVVDGEQMLLFEKFVATDGASCPQCGADKGWGDHDCDDGIDSVEK